MPLRPVLCGWGGRRIHRYLSLESSMNLIRGGLQVVNQCLALRRFETGACRHFYRPPGPLHRGATGDRWQGVKLKATLTQKVCGLVQCRESDLGAVRFSSFAGLRAAAHSGRFAAHQKAQRLAGSKSICVSYQNPEYRRSCAS